MAGPCRVWVAPCPLHPPSLVPPQRHQGLVQPLPSEAPVWEPPQHGELRQQAAQVRGVPGGRSSPGSPPPPLRRSQSRPGGAGASSHSLLPTPGSTRTGRAWSVSCVPSWRASTSPTRWRSGWRRTSTPTWTSCGTWSGTTGPSSASTPAPRRPRGCAPPSPAPAAPRDWAAGAPVGVWFAGCTPLLLEAWLLVGSYCTESSCAPRSHNKVFL